ncbi:DALR anticodon-binding domain-containing protein 3 isoform X7 [Oryctolagus cuniculus]|uniref:DALR anticodon-binding domain-containing protein 3 isoform X7 n=1 Tax=Oryctolagus cuniculus TaxID=9986 RepID=UPI00387A1927
MATHLVLSDVLITCKMGGMKRYYNNTNNLGIRWGSPEPHSLARIPSVAANARRPRDVAAQPGRAEGALGGFSGSAPVRGASPGPAQSGTPSPEVPPPCTRLPVPLTTSGHHGDGAPWCRGDAGGSKRGAGARRPGVVQGDARPAPACPRLPGAAARSAGAFRGRAGSRARVPGCLRPAGPWYSPGAGLRADPRGPGAAAAAARRLRAGSRRCGRLRLARLDGPARRPPLPGSARRPRRAPPQPAACGARGGSPGASTACPRAAAPGAGADGCVVVHVLSCEDEFQQQKLDLLWWKLDDQAPLRQKHLVCGPVRAVGAAMTAPEYYESRHAQVCKASALKRGGDPAQDPAWTEIAGVLSVATIKFEMLSTAPRSQLLLAPADSSISTKGTKSGIFVMYNCARLATLFESYKRSEEQGLYPPFPSVASLDFSLLQDEGEWLLLFNSVLPFPELLSQLAALAPTTPGLHLPARTETVCKFLVQLSMDFSSYYNRVHVLGVSTRPGRGAEARRGGGGRDQPAPSPAGAPAPSLRSDVCPAAASEGHPRGAPRGPGSAGPPSAEPHLRPQGLRSENVHRLMDWKANKTPHLLLTAWSHNKEFVIKLCPVVGGLRGQPSTHLSLLL